MQTSIPPSKFGHTWTFRNVGLKKYWKILHDPLSGVLFPVLLLLFIPCLTWPPNTIWLPPPIFFLRRKFYPDEGIWYTHTDSGAPQIPTARPYHHRWVTSCYNCAVIPAPSCGSDPLYLPQRGGPMRRPYHNASRSVKYGEDMLPLIGWGDRLGQGSLMKITLSFLWFDWAPGSWLPHGPVDPGAPWLLTWKSGTIPWRGGIAPALKIVVH